MQDLIFTLPLDKQSFFRAVRSDVGKVQNDLVDVLFPRGLSQNTSKPNP